jgi:hypothetical protein
MKLSERIYKFIDDVGGVGPNNETRVRHLCKEVTKLEAELSMYEGDETFASLAIRVTELEAENEALREGNALLSMAVMGKQPNIFDEIEKLKAQREILVKSMIAKTHSPNEERFSKLEVLYNKVVVENERLWKFFHAGGDHDWSCQSTHGTGLPCDCGFQEVLDALLKGE